MTLPRHPITVASLERGREFSLFLSGVLIPWIW
jgi:hypothetical protein